MTKIEDNLSQKLIEAEKFSGILKGFQSYEPPDAELSALGYDATIDLARTTLEKFDEITTGEEDKDLLKASEEDLSDVIDLLKEKTGLIKGQIESQYGKDSDEYKAISSIKV